jgi:hypothetical protein
VERRDTLATIVLFLKTMMVGMELMEVVVMLMVIKEEAVDVMEEDV